MHRGAHDPLDPTLRRRLDPPLATAPRQLVAHHLHSRVGPRDVICQPRLKRSCILHRALAKAKLLADLRAVILHRPPGPLVRRQLARRDVDLAGDEPGRLLRQLIRPVREPTVVGVELQQQREPKPGRAALARHQLAVTVKQRPVLDKLI